MEPPEAFLAWCYTVSTGSALLTKAEVERRGLPDATKLLDDIDWHLRAIVVYAKSGSELEAVALDARKLIARTHLAPVAAKEDVGPKCRCTIIVNDNSASTWCPVHGEQG